MDSGRPEGGQDRDVDLLIEKGFLLLGSIEFQIEQHLMSHGTRIEPETRFFMAQVRDAAGDAAARLLDEARSRLDAAPIGEAGQTTEAAGEDGAPGVIMLPQPSDVISPPPAKGAPRRLHRPRRRLGRVAIGAGMAAAGVCAALLLSVSAPAPEKLGTASNDKLAAAPAAAQRQATAGAPEGLAIPPAIAWARATGRLMGHAAGRVIEHATGRLAGAAAGNATGYAAGAAGYATEHVSQPDFRPKAVYATGAMVWSEDVLQRLIVARRLSLAARTADRQQPPYPDPRARPEEAFATAAQPAAEAALELSRATRIEVQRRLALADFDPRLFDGIFGPATRAALGAWQSAAGLTPTGYLDNAALALLRQQTERDYRAWKAKRARTAARNARTVQTSPLPTASPSRGDRCDRAATGAIVYGRGVRCDWRGLREDLARLFG
jgi:hypothetical protein